MKNIKDIVKKHLNKKLQEQVENPSIGQTTKDLYDGSYMVVQNLKQIKMDVEKILSFANKEDFSTFVTGDHAWAGDHISTSKDDIEEVLNFIEGSNNDYSQIEDFEYKQNISREEGIPMNMYENTKPPKLKIINENTKKISLGLNFHLTKKKPIIENTYRPYSEKYFNLFNECRQHFNDKTIEFFGDDVFLLNTDIGKTGIYEGKKVYLDIPFLLDEEEHLVEAEYRGRKVKLNKPFRDSSGSKKFGVYVKNKKGNVIKVGFGDPNMKVRSNNKKAAKSFRARHNCKDKKDRTKAGYWSCNISRYRKALGIKSKNPW